MHSTTTPAAAEVESICLHDSQLALGCCEMHWHKCSIMVAVLMHTLDGTPTQLKCCLPYRQSIKFAIKKLRKNRRL